MSAGTFLNDGLTERRRNIEAVNLYAESLLRASMMTIETRATIGCRKSPRISLKLLHGKGSDE